MDLLRKERFKKRFLTYYPMLCRVAQGYVSNLEECEDVVQNTFVALWQHDKDELEDSEFLRYAVRAVKNNSISAARRRLAEVSTQNITDILEAGHDFSDEEQPVGELTADEAVQAALAVLPDKCRQVFELAKMQGMKYRDIAIELHIAEKTVESHMAKAVRLLRTYVAQHPLAAWIIVVGLKWLD